MYNDKSIPPYDNECQIVKASDYTPSESQTLSQLDNKFY